MTNALDCADRILALINGRPVTPHRDEIAALIEAGEPPDRLTEVSNAIRTLCGKPGSVKGYAFENCGELGLRLWPLALAGWKPEPGQALAACVGYGLVQASPDRNEDDAIKNVYAKLFSKASS